VEAPPKASSLQVLRHAITIDRPAMVVPGPVTSVLSTGCHQALRQHREARLVTSIDDVLTGLTIPNATTPGK
jgi:DNA processing protein